MIDNEARRIFFPEKGDVIYLLKEKKWEIGRTLDNGYVCVGNEKSEYEGFWRVKLEYRGEPTKCYDEE